MSEGLDLRRLDQERRRVHLEVGRVVHVGAVSIVIFGSKQGVSLWPCRSN
jgi:hypothetical protein